MAPRHERRTWAAGGVNLVAMAVEIVGGSLLNSAALLAEGFHMGAHVVAMVIAGLGYRLAARVRTSRGDGAACAVVDAASILNAGVLFAIAALLFVESVEHLQHPAPIPFAEAIALALFGLAVTFCSLALLHEAHDHGRRRDMSFHAIYLHMIGDASVGVLSVFGVTLVAILHWTWADGFAGLCGAVLIAALAAQIVVAVAAQRDLRRRSSTFHKA